MYVILVPKIIDGLPEDSKDVQNNSPKHFWTEEVNIILNQNRSRSRDGLVFSFKTGCIPVIKVINSHKK